MESCINFTIQSPLSMSVFGNKFNQTSKHWFQFLRSQTAVWERAFLIFKETSQQVTLVL